MMFVALGCSQTEFLYAAQQPQQHKRKMKQEAEEESISKKPREEEKEEAERINCNIVEITAENFKENEPLLAALGPIYAAAFLEDERRLHLTLGIVEETAVIIEILENRWKQEIRKLRKSLNSEHPKRCVFITLSNERNELIGFTKFYFRSQESYIRSLKSGAGDAQNVIIAPISQALPEAEDVYIEYIGIKPGYAHKGLGKEMMNYIQAIPSIRLIYLEVGADNKIAIGFYERLGFKQQGNYSFVDNLCYIYSKVIQK
jgi:ribosomal protein S18 acetylase RimI-like enzyme